MRVARTVVLDKEERGRLEQIARGRSLPARLVERARIVLRAAVGLQDQQIASELGITPEKAARWRNRYLDGGLEALGKDATRPGRPRTITEERTAEVIHKTTQEKPFNATHWSTRTMAASTGVSETTVRRIWHAKGLKPHLVKTFKVSNDTQFAAKLEVIVGLYLNPPEHDFDKGRKSVEAQKLRASLAMKVARMVKLNRTRMDFLEEFQKMIDEYNAGSSNVEIYFAKLMAFAKKLNAEEKRGIGEQLSEEELVIFDLLTKPVIEMSKGEMGEVKKVARVLLAKVKQEKLVLDWRKQQTTRAGVRLVVEEVLDTLPRVYDKGLYAQKCDVVYQHFYEGYAGPERSVYGG